MTADAFGKLVILYGWFLLVGLIVFLMLIARFYQRFSGERTHFRLYIIPMVLFGIRAVRQTYFQRDPIGDILASSAGFVLIGLVVYLYWRMTSGRGTA